MRASRGRPSRDPLAPIHAIERLEVGPVEITPRSAAASYQVTLERSFRDAGRRPPPRPAKLIYRFEEDVFDPADAGSRNLASLMLAQVALNYSLFARTILFRGGFDRVDREFLAAMSELTAREIYVKKFLEPNPFLAGEARRLQAAPVARDRYARAELVFEPTGNRPGAGSRRAAEVFSWRDPDPERHGILSSGGKESLLTYGVLRELGLEVHPLFVNESGRHWFTALNGHRRLQADCTHTARVWTSSDRVFNAMDRALPFIRPDFGRLRSDDYPIRLWTVAVFLFGVLPLVRKRRIGRLLAGDEFDTTRHVETHGIGHHDGLYDQSLDFDRALTTFYERKGWPLVQFSALRPLSEFLVQKTLAERYPDLLSEQVSCHAASMNGRRARPCGRCEKCRRVVTMLAAMGADPKRLGYGAASVKKTLAAVAADPDLHQEGAGVDHLLWKLRDRGLIAASAPAGRRARAHPEIESLRFDPARSPEDAVPADLAGRLRRIFEQHAAPGAGDDHLIAHLTWPRAEARLRETDTALLPVGAIEQHGPHLPLDVDAWDADHLAREVARRVSHPRPLVLPLIPYGVSYQHDDFSGTLSVQPESLARMVYDLGMSAARQGIAKLVIVNGHGGNVPALQYAAQMINRDAHIFTAVESGDTSDEEVERLVGCRNDVHAGEIETSAVLATRPELVDMDKAEAAIPRFANPWLDFGAERSVEWFGRTGRISSSGVLGDPTRATRETGEKIWALMITRLAEFIETLKGMTLDEIHQRRP